MSCRICACTEWWHVRAAQSTCNLKKRNQRVTLTRVLKWRIKFKVNPDCTRDPGTHPWITYWTQVHLYPYTPRPVSDPFFCNIPFSLYNIPFPSNYIVQFSLPLMIQLNPFPFPFLSLNTIFLLLKIPSPSLCVFSLPHSIPFHSYPIRVSLPCSLYFSLSTLFPFLPSFTSIWTIYAFLHSWVDFLLFCFVPVFFFFFVN